jgi:hypothetical protein
MVGRCGKMASFKINDNNMEFVNPNLVMKFPG